MCLRVAVFDYAFQLCIVESVGTRPSRDAYPQFADVWVPPGYDIELLRISEYSYSLCIVSSARVR